MRDDVVTARTTVDHPADQVWQVIGTPELYSRFVPEISWCEVTEPAGSGRGPTALIRLCPRRDVVAQETIQAMVYRVGKHVVWCGQRYQDRWLSIELVELEPAKTEIVVQLRMPGVASRDAELVTPSVLRRTVSAVAQRIGLHLSGLPAPATDRARQAEDAKATALGTASVLVKAGVLSAGRPDKMARQLSALARWGATLAGGYQAAAARGPAELALHDERGLRTFHELDERSNRLATALARRGVKEGDRAVLMCRNHGAMIETLIACGKLGVDAIMLNTGLSVAGVADVISRHRPSTVFADDEFTATMEQVPGDFHRFSTWADADGGYIAVDDLISSTPDERPAPVSKPAQLVVLTSGTTGAPKGAQRPTPKGLSTAAALLARIPLRAGDRIMVAAPLFHTWGLAGLQIGMALRASLTLIRRFDAQETLRVLAENRCDALFAVPVMLQRILDLPTRVRDRYDLSSLRIIASSGSALPGSFVTDFMDVFGDKLYNLYGSTEVSWASIADPYDLRAAPTTAGRCPPGTRVAVLDHRGEHVPPGGSGQIFVGNEMLFDGYTDGGSLPTAHQLMATGDIGYADADGRLFVTGRADEMIVSGGENVFPRPVEEELAALPEIHEAAVVGVPDTEYGQRLAAYLVLRRGARLSADDVREYIHQRLARFFVPRDVYFVPNLPRNATGKVLKRLLNDDFFPVDG